MGLNVNLQKSVKDIKTVRLPARKRSIRVIVGSIITEQEVSNVSENQPDVTTRRSNLTQSIIVTPSYFTFCMGVF